MLSKSDMYYDKQSIQTFIVITAIYNNIHQQPSLVCILTAPCTVVKRRHLFFLHLPAIQYQTGILCGQRKISRCVDPRQQAL